MHARTPAVALARPRLRASVLLCGVLALSACAPDQPPVVPGPSATSVPTSTPGAVAPSPTTSPATLADQLAQLLVLPVDLPELTGVIEDEEVNERNQRLNETVRSCAGPDTPQSYGEGILRGQALENADGTLSVESSAQESSMSAADAHRAAHESELYLRCVVEALTEELEEALPGSDAQLTSTVLPAPAPNISVIAISGTLSTSGEVVTLWSQDYLVTHTLPGGVAETNFSVSVTGQTDETARAATTRAGSRVLAQLAKRTG